MEFCCSLDVCVCFVRSWSFWSLSLVMVRVSFTGIEANKDLTSKETMISSLDECCWMFWAKSDLFLTEKQFLRRPGNRMETRCFDTGYLFWWWWIFGETIIFQLMKTQAPAETSYSGYQSHALFNDFFPISKTKFWWTSIKCFHDNSCVHFNFRVSFTAVFDRRWIRYNRSVIMTK